MTSSDTRTAHRPMTLLVGTADCLERDCEEYVTEAGDNDPGVERCSHIREETVCATCSGEQNQDGFYETTVAWTADHAPAVSS